MPKRYFIALSVFLVVAIVYWFANSKNAQQVCEDQGGKWASNEKYCVTRSCVKTGSCGTWASPIARCGLVPPNASRDEVYFQLGMPETTSATTATWSAAKDSAEKIRADFSGDRLVKLECPA
ncbi:MAG: hypothetical protein Q4G39_00730 [Brachymonas sp.]|nr:hypothetical protein [Brachymonas sp.]